MAKIQLDLDEKGFGTVIIDGKDISDVVAGINITCFPGEQTTVHIQLIPIALSAEGEFTNVELEGADELTQ